MPEIRKQGISNSLIIYVGVVIGYINVVLLFPRFFSQAEFGLTRLLLTVSQILALLSLVGFNNVTLKYFPYFKKNPNYQSGFFVFALLIPLAGFIVTSGLFLLLKPWVIESYSDNSALFVEYYNWVFPFTFVLIFFNALREFSRSLYQAVLPIIFKEIVIRLGITVSILLTTFQIINFQSFLYFFILAHAIPFLGYMIYFYNINLFTFRPRFSFLNLALFKEMLIYGFYTVGNRFSGMLSRRVDILMLGALTGIKDVAVYTIAFFIGNVVVIPSQGLRQIAAPKVANAFANNFSHEINAIFKKSALNQLMAGGLVFVVIWSNIQPILEIINPDYLRAEFVVLFIGLAKLTGVSTGVSDQVIMHSQYFRKNLGFITLLLALTVIFNLLFIPVFQIVGAAMGTALAILIVNIVKTGFIYQKLGYHPFSIKMLTLLGLIGLIFMIGEFLPVVSLAEVKPLWNNLLTIVYRSLVLTAIFGLGVLILKPSEDVEDIIKKMKKKYL